MEEVLAAAEKFCSALAICSYANLFYDVSSVRQNKKQLVFERVLHFISFKSQRYLRRRELVQTMMHDAMFFFQDTLTSIP